MKRTQGNPLCRILALFLVAMVFFPPVSAAKATPTPTPTPTVPPVLQACSQATVPSAAFFCQYPPDSAAPISDGPPYILKCFDNSTTQFNQSVISWKWDFGDGSASSDQNPEHTYAEPSRYDISLTVTTFCGSQYTNTTVNTVSIYCSVPEPGFTTNVTGGYAPLAVEVTDTSLKTREDITQWTYWFDDTHSSTERNPVFVYTEPGTYTINQSVSKDCVQLGSRLSPPATREIRVYSSSDILGGNGTGAPSQATLPTPAAASPTNHPVTSATSPPVSATGTSITWTGAPDTGALSVSTDPSGAQIFVDDVMRGTSPFTVPDLSAGSHTIRFELEGYESLTTSVVIRDGKTTSFSTSLSPRSSIAFLPLAALSVIILAIIIGGVLLFLRQRAMNED